VLLVLCESVGSLRLLVGHLRNWLSLLELVRSLVRIEWLGLLAESTTEVGGRVRLGTLLLLLQRVGGLGLLVGLLGDWLSLLELVGSLVRVEGLGVLVEKTTLLEFLIQCIKTSGDPCQGIVIGVAGTSLEVKESIVGGGKRCCRNGADETSGEEEGEVMHFEGLRWVDYEAWIEKNRKKDRECIKTVK
jgi:hypothetical protein